jgi:hypothetical protein
VVVGVVGNGDGDEITSADLLGVASNATAAALSGTPRDRRRRRQRLIDSSQFG